MATVTEKKVVNPLELIQNLRYDFPAQSGPPQTQVLYPPTDDGAARPAYDERNPGAPMPATIDPSYLDGIYGPTSSVGPHGAGTYQGNPVYQGIYANPVYPNGAWWGSTDDSMYYDPNTGTPYGDMYPVQYPGQQTGSSGMQGYEGPGTGATPAGYTSFNYSPSTTGTATPEYQQLLYELQNTGAGIKLPDYRNFEFTAQGSPQTAPGQVQGQYTLNDLMTDLQRNNYTPLTQEQMAQQADNRYTETYNTQRLAAQQSQQIADQGLEQQYLGLERAYNDLREQTAQQYGNAYATADRQALSRGMARSSYNNQVLSNIDLQGAEQQERIGERQIGDQNQIEAQRALLSRQLGERLEQMTASEIADKLAYQDALEAREYDRTVANQDRNNALTQGVYDRSQAAAAQTNAFNQWAAEFESGSQQFYDQMNFNTALTNWQGQNEYDQYNTTLAEQQRQFNENMTYDAAKSNWQGVNEHSRWAATFNENQRQFLENQLFQGAQNNWQGLNDYNQWTTQLSENQRQFDANFAENARQFGLEYALRLQEMMMNAGGAVGGSSGGAVSGGSSGSGRSTGSSGSYFGTTDDSYSSGSSSSYDTQPTTPPANVQADLDAALIAAQEAAKKANQAVADNVNKNIEKKYGTNIMSKLTSQGSYIPTVAFN